MSRSASSPPPASPSVPFTVEQPPLTIPQTIWTATIPLLISHVADPSTPLLVLSAPRLGYLALLLPRAAAFFGRPCSSFHHEGVLLRNLPTGLLVDLYVPELPWRLTVDEGPSWDITDTYMNSAKEADYVRNGNSNQIMKLSKERTTALWDAVRDNDLRAFKRIYNILLDTPKPLKNVPIRLFVPSSPPQRDGASAGNNAPEPPASPPAATTTEPAKSTKKAAALPDAGSFRVVQTLVPAVSPVSGTLSRLGIVLQQLLPKLFPSSRDPVIANVVLHGAPVPFSTPLEELMWVAAYPDGWLCFVVVLL